MEIVEVLEPLFGKKMSFSVRSNGNCAFCSYFNGSLNKNYQIASPDAVASTSNNKMTFLPAAVRYSLTSISTPAGKSSFIKASIVLEEGW
jgi:hypothetical protein